MSDTTKYCVKDKNLIIYMAQDLDHHNAEKIRIQSDKIIAEQKIKNVVFDFSKVSFMDSSGIGVIMGRYRKVMYDDGKVVVTGLNKITDKILKMAALYKIVEKYETVEEAIEKICM